MAYPTADFGIGFNNPVFCDRVLRIEVIADPLDSEVDCSTNEKMKGKKGLDKEKVIKVQKLHINSLILAANSPFFHKLFDNGMRESHQRIVTLRINAFEDEALMDILKFMYNNTVSETPPDLLRVLMVADKFEVTSCVRYCREALKKMPMSLELALSYIELHRADILVDEAVQSLVDAAKKYLTALYSDFDKSRKEVMDLPLCAIEAFLGSKGLKVDTEDDVFDFVLKWACEHYPNLEERREILTKLLDRCICFSCMSSSKLKDVLVSPDFGHEQVSKLVTDALFFKIDNYTSKDLVDDTKCSSLGRLYKLRPVKVVQFELPQPRCVVYFDLKKEECENLYPSGTLKSQSFRLGGRWFCLWTQSYTMEQKKSFGLFLKTTNDSESCTVDYEFAVMNKSSKEFQGKWEGNFNHSQLIQGYGRGNLLGISWTDFMSKDCVYFIDGILHLRADLTINNSYD